MGGANTTLNVNDTMTLPPILPFTINIAFKEQKTFLTSTSDIGVRTLMDDYPKSM